MTRATRNASLAVVAIAGMALLLPALAQRAAEPSTPDVGHAKEIVKLIGQGQLNLAGATAIAEKHIEGTALGAKCEIRGDQSDPKSREPHARHADGQQPSGPRLIYNVTCFAKDKVQMLQVDGLTKEVVTP